MAHLGHRTPGLAYLHYIDPILVQQSKPLAPPIPGIGGQALELPNASAPGEPVAEVPPVEPLAPPMAAAAGQRTLKDVALAYVAGSTRSDAYRSRLFAIVKELDRWQGLRVHAEMLTDALLLDWLAWKRDRLTSPTVVQHRRMLVRLWAFAFASGWTTIDPHVNSVWKAGHVRQRRQIACIQTEPGELRHFLRTVFAPTRLVDKSPHTLRLYETTCGNLARFLGREARLTDLTNETAKRFLRWYAEGEKVRSIKSVAKERSNLISLWNFACRQHIVWEFPEIPVIGPERGAT